MEELLRGQEERLSRRFEELLAALSGMQAPPTGALVRRHSRFFNAATARIALVCLVLCLFFCCTWPAPLIGFDNDDVTNLHGAWSKPLTSLLTSNPVPFTTFYRPAGAAYYRICFALFGWHPFGFRAVSCGLMLANLLLLYLLAKRLSDSREVAAIATLLYTFHAGLRQIYMSNGAVYDVLCATLFMSALLFTRIFAARAECLGRGRHFSFSGSSWHR